MSKKERLKKEQREAEHLLASIEEKLAEALAIEAKADSDIEDKRDRLDDSPTAERREELRDAVEELIEIREDAAKEAKRLQPRRKRAAKRVKKIGRQLRNLFKPKVIDLELWRTAVRPLVRQSALIDTVGHYTAGPRADDLDEAIRLWRVFDQAHKNQGWACLGYPWGVAPDGTIVLLRGREWVGAHTLNYNTGHDGCSVHGTTGDSWTRLQRRGFRYALKRFGTIDRPVIGHREAPGQATACPGDFLTGYKTKGRKA